VRSILQTSTDHQELVEPVHVPEAIDTALTLVRSQVRHHASIIWEPEEALYALAHRTKLVQVVVNLVVNASHSFIDSHTSAHEIRIRAYQEAERVVIQVRDNGPGMTAEVKERALEPFFTTKEPGRGSGLGLFLCNSIIESLHGTLQIESSAGLGTTVTIRLPFTDQPPKSRVTCRNAPLNSEPPSVLRVLVVDDEPEIRRALHRVLGHLCTISTCANGAEAWQHFVRGEKYDVILCDLLMPEMNGMELFGALAKDHPDQAERMLFLTGGATSDAARNFLQKHVARVVNKPFNPKEVEAVVRTTARFPMPIAVPSVMPASRS
jgi:CheY-like chemotaxis protein